MANPILTTLERRGLRIGLWDACLVANAVRWDQLRLEDFHLTRENRVHLTKLLRRMDYLELKFAGSKAADGYAEDELKALKWAIACILYIAGEKTDEEKAIANDQ